MSILILETLHLFIKIILLLQETLFHVVILLGRVKDVVNRNSTTKPLKSVKQKRKYFPKKVLNYR